MAPIAVLNGVVLNPVKKELTEEQKKVTELVDSLPEHLASFLKSKHPKEGDILKLSVHAIKAELKLLPPAEKRRPVAKTKLSHTQQTGNLK